MISLGKVPDKTEYNSSDVVIEFNPYTLINVKKIYIMYIALKYFLIL